MSAAKTRAQPMPVAVQAAFARYPTSVRKRLLILRQMILETAAANEVGPVEESLKWGQPSYATADRKSGSPIRIDHVKSSDRRTAMYFHCQTDLVENFREMYPHLTFSGNRAIEFDAGDEIPIAELRYCIALALTYYARKNKARR